MSIKASTSGSSDTSVSSMDSPAITQLFRQLFRHRPCRAKCAPSRFTPRLARSYSSRTSCQSTRSPSIVATNSTQLHRIPQRRSISHEAPPKTSSQSDWQQRTDIFPLDMSEEYRKYPLVTADQLRGRRERPKRVKMLTRDFIEGNQFAKYSMEI